MINSAFPPLLLLLIFAALHLNPARSERAGYYEDEPGEERALPSFSGSDELYYEEDTAAGEDLGDFFDEASDRVYHGAEAADSLSEFKQLVSEGIEVDILLG